MATDGQIQVVTANRLRDGIPVYFAGQGIWSPRIADAVHGADGVALLSDANAGPRPLPAVGLYVIDVAIVDGVVGPIGLREQIRAFGPTA
jgi:hypothetical protein